MQRRSIVTGALLGAGFMLLLAGGYRVALASAAVHTHRSSVAVEVARPLSPVRDGMVVNYVPGVAITIRSSEGQTTTFTLDDQLVVIPAARAGDIAVGKTVTILTPNGSDSVKTAIGIILHPLPGEPGGAAVPAADPLSNLAG